MTKKEFQILQSIDLAELTLNQLDDMQTKLLIIKYDKDILNRRESEQCLKLILKIKKEMFNR
jgi:hypothetical protein